jgi:hypothetical protein
MLEAAVQADEESCRRIADGILARVTSRTQARSDGT